LQRRVELPGRLQVGSVNRASVSSTGVGGKGQGAWLATQQLGAAAAAAVQAAADEASDALPLLVQFIGTGNEGDQLAAALRAKAPGADEGMWVRTAAPTRICTTLVSADSGEATEIVEPSGGILPGEYETLLSALDESTAGQAPGVLLMGSMPPGVPGDAYGAVVRAAASEATKVVIDSVTGFDATAEAVAAQGCPALLKLNGRELLALAGEAPPAGSDSEVACDPASVAAAACKLAAKAGGGKALAAVCWTDGPFPGGVYDCGTGKRWALAMPPLPGPVLSPVGAGDAVAGGTFHAWLRPGETSSSVDSGVPVVVRAFAFGLACGAASCLTAENSVFDLATVRSIHAAIEIIEGQ